ncbi:hypothetical protein BDZ91DRAFT_711894 [Kalaharituber pfeilii]|nr:hypothetical protein BDZ91DRAFT_711894 [Kalaharituber pfeilii]
MATLSSPSPATQEGLSESLPRPPVTPPPRGPLTPPPQSTQNQTDAAKPVPAPIRHCHNIVSSTSIAKKVSQCLEQLFPELSQPPQRRNRTSSNAQGVTVSDSAAKKGQIIITLTAKSVSAPKAITICEILKRRIAQQGMYWYQYCALEEVMEEVKPKTIDRNPTPQRNEMRRSSWAGGGIPSTPSKQQTRSPAASPMKPPSRLTPTPTSKPPPKFSVNPPASTPSKPPSRLMTRHSSRSLRRQVDESPRPESSMDLDDPFGPMSPLPGQEPLKKRPMPVLTIYLSTERIQEYKDLHGEQSNSNPIKEVVKKKK